MYSAKCALDKAYRKPCNNNKINSCFNWLINNKSHSILSSHSRKYHYCAHNNYNINANTRLRTCIATKGNRLFKCISVNLSSGRELVSDRCVYTLDGVTKRLTNGRLLFDNIRLQFNDGAKIGIVGNNGSGKSSLLRIIAGIDNEYDGLAYVTKGYKIGYLPQEPQLDNNLTVLQNITTAIQHKKQLLQRYDEICESFNDPNCDVDKLTNEQSILQAEIDRLQLWNLNEKVAEALKALNCPPGESSVSYLSGGEVRRVALCRLLLSEPDILLLDEPTNHLDADSVNWLEQFLSNYKGLVIAITHDRYFLDKVAGYILEISQGHLFPFKGNYESWLRLKHARLLNAEVRNIAFEKQLEKELSWISSGGPVRKKSIRAKNLEKMLNEKKEKSSNKVIEGGGLLIPEGPPLIQTPIKFMNISHEFEGKKLFSNLSFEVNSGDIIGIVGSNGSGKSTLLRLLVGEYPLQSGSIFVDKCVIFGYNAQKRKLIDDEPVWKYIVGNNDTIQIHKNLSIHSRAYVAQFNFCGQNQSKLCGSLSGGERNRASLAKSLAAGCNVILLDEPTNDLDIDTLRNLEISLAEFDGAALVVSHDRWFLDRIATHILAFENNGKTIFFQGNYTQYEKFKKQQTNMNNTIIYHDKPKQSIQSLNAN